MESKQQTAVDWLWEKLLEETETGELRYHLKHDVVKVFNEALKMEREQIINAYDGFPINARNCQNGEQYYEEIYGTDKD
jgi:hypothetical protein